MSDDRAECECTSSGPKSTRTVLKSVRKARGYRKSRRVFVMLETFHLSSKKIKKLLGWEVKRLHLHQNTSSCLTSTCSTSTWHEWMRNKKLHLIQLPPFTGETPFSASIDSGSSTHLQHHPTISEVPLTKDPTSTVASRPAPTALYLTDSSTSGLLTTVSAATVGHHVAPATGGGPAGLTGQQAPSELNVGDEGEVLDACCLNPLNPSSGLHPTFSFSVVLQIPVGAASAPPPLWTRCWLVCSLCSLSPPLSSSLSSSWSSASGWTTQSSTGCRTFPWWGGRPNPFSQSVSQSSSYIVRREGFCVFASCGIYFLYLKLCYRN